MELRSILQRITEYHGGTSQINIEETVHKAGQRIEETISRLAARLDKAAGFTTESSPQNGDIATRRFDLHDFYNIENGYAFRLEIVHSRT